MKQIFLSIVSFVWGIAGYATVVSQSGNAVTICPDRGEARVIRLQVVDDGIIRVRATSEDALPEKEQSLIVLKEMRERGMKRGGQLPWCEVKEGKEDVTVRTRKMSAVVAKSDGRIVFYDAAGQVLLREAVDGKTFKEFQVPEREIGSGQPTKEQQQGLSWRLLFDSPADEAFYGLGQHQSEELNMKGKNEDLFQYNTKVAVPFVVSNKNYGVLWDSYSYCRFGNPEDYLQLNRAFRLYDKEGKEGHLTGTYTDRGGRQLVREEDSLYFEYALPDHSEIGKTDKGGIQNLPKGFRLEGAKVVYEGSIEAPETSNYQFILYYAGYIKVYVGGKEVVAERWRTAWNPNAYKFAVPLKRGEKTALRIEWQPDGSVSYCGLRVAAPRTTEEQGQLSIWSEMSRDMDYYVIAGKNMDEVISGYRTLTGKAPVYPKWVMGFWQSRERYKTADELTGTLEEFRKRHIPIDNIVQDWNYWKEDEWGSHDFETARFPDPQGMLDKVHQLHGRYMISVWPKFYCSTDHYKELDSKGWMYQQAVKDDIRDWVGPGYVGSFYDAYAEGARKLFWQQMDEHLYSKYNYGIDAWWMDASEPNVRDCTPMWYRKALCGSTALGTSTEYFNAYSIVNADAIYNGQRSTWKALAGKKGAEPRVFLLTRSGFAGEQRYSTATWSGDIGTRWEDMRAQMTAGMNYSLSGLPFWGMDQGGFCVENRYVRAQQVYDQTHQENDDLKEWRELQARWNQFGCFIPIYRAHGQWPLREVWNIAPEGHPAYESIVWYHRLRYRMMPYLYSMAGWVHLHDYTMMRALVMDFNGDKNVQDIKDQWMFGPALMACPVSTYQARSREVYFPKECGWYDLYTGKKVIDSANRNEPSTLNPQPSALNPTPSTLNSKPSTLNPTPSNRTLVIDAPYERIPVFVPEGAILPIGPDMEWSDEKPAELIDLYIYAGRDGQFELYEDEGTNYNYEKGAFSTISIQYDDVRKVVTIGERKGKFEGMLKQRQFNIVLVTPNSAQPLASGKVNGRLVNYTGKALSVNLSNAN